MSSYAAGRSGSVSSVTSVLTWIGRPSAWAQSTARMVMSNVPGTPRKPSWRAASEPSMLSDIVWMPAALSAARRSMVMSGVAAGASDAPMPRSVAARTSVSRSGRRRGSPPVKTTWGYGCPKPVTRSSRAIALLGRQLAGIAFGHRGARQCLQARPHDRVVSQ